MPKVKVRSDRQVKIPESIFRRLNLKAGDVLEIFGFKGGIVFVPKEMARSKNLLKELNEQRWDRKEEEADAAITKGDVSGPFHTAKELIAHLRKQKV